MSSDMELTRSLTFAVLLISTLLIPLHAQQASNSTQRQRSDYKGECGQDDHCVDTLTCISQECRCEEIKYFDQQTQRCQRSKAGRYCAGSSDCPLPLQCRDQICACEETEWYDTWYPNCIKIPEVEWFTDDRTGYTYKVFTGAPASFTASRYHCRAINAYLPTAHTDRETARIAEILLALGCDQSKIVLGMKDADGKHLVLDVENITRLTPADNETDYRVMCQRGIGMYGKCNDKNLQCAIFMDCHDGICVCPKDTVYDVDTYRCEQVYPQNVTSTVTSNDSYFTEVQVGDALRPTLATETATGQTGETEHDNDVVILVSVLLGASVLVSLLIGGVIYYGKKKKKNEIPAELKKSYSDTDSQLSEGTSSLEMSSVNDPTTKMSKISYTSSKATSKKSYTSTMDTSKTGSASSKATSGASYWFL